MINIRLLIIAALTLAAAAIAAVVLAYGLGIEHAESMPEQSATSSPSGTEH